MRSIPAQLSGRPFALAEAERLGLTRRMLSGDRFVRVRRGVYRCIDTPPTLRLQVQAALLVLPPGTAASHTTALALGGLTIGRHDALHFSGHGRPEHDIEGVVLHRRRVRLNTVLVDGVPALGPLRTFVDAATVLSMRDLLAVGDWLVFHEHVDVLDLRAYAIASHLDGVRTARRVAPLVRERVASVYESYVRWDLHAAGLPEPEVNVDILDDHGTWLARGDLVYRPWRILVEYDGWQHERDAQQRQRDHLRREALEAAGWRVIVITVEDMRRPGTVVSRVRQAIRQAA
ncbi:DUF559 domain-containing protein [Aeromicrobium sp. CFBP 8757]|uniref:DUF559 domain-containing protein n=1 Tax=Aeromicrobium sp. CFBP 8757 TaxID=2775288 RepID=UPI001780DC03|nr:DUF559 domain-containing protein [Aeromicrobium sp. CFBP 8757]MBD8607697.1 DUF559 domain-containing protein [Aeromicrobium sp. CFBP 8757]